MVKLKGFDRPVSHVRHGPVVDVVFRGGVGSGHRPLLHQGNLLLLELGKLLPKLPVQFRGLHSGVAGCLLGPLMVF